MGCRQRFCTNSPIPSFPAQVPSPPLTDISYDQSPLLNRVYWFQIYQCLKIFHSIAQSHHVHLYICLQPRYDSGIVISPPWCYMRYTVSDCARDLSRQSEVSPTLEVLHIVFRIYWVQLGHTRMYDVHDLRQAIALLPKLHKDKYFVFVQRELQECIPTICSAITS